MALSQIERLGDMSDEITRERQSVNNDSY